VRFVPVFLMVVGLQMGCATGSSLNTQSSATGTVLPGTLLNAVKTHWKGATVAAASHAAAGCADRQAQPPAYVSGDFNGDGAPDIALVLQTPSGMRVVAALFQTSDYRLTDVAASIDLTNATLSVRPRGAIYRVPDIAVDNYFSSDTILVKT